jgi:UDP-hydrolysing UDP-N-acetyl-D-glucosamine 2-epimerase
MPSPRRRIAVLSTSRADYGHLYWPLRELAARPEIELSLLVTGAHLAPELGQTVTAIEADGFPIAERIECLLSSDSDVGMAKTIGVAVLGLADALGRLRPDLLLLIADRYEMLAPAAVALALRIPIAHIEGGEVSEGAIDDAVRNALTKMSHLHFTTTDTARRRVLALGEERWRVHRTGAPSLDHLRRRTLPSRAHLEAELGIDLGRPTVVVSYHPVTLPAGDPQDTTAEAAALFAALAALPHQLIFCFPNADAGSRSLIARTRAFCAERPAAGGRSAAPAAPAHLLVHLEHLRYWGLLREAAALVGNSSSGIMETASLALPTVNVGERQRGRERPANVLDTPAEPAALAATLERALSPAFRAALAGMSNPYGDGRAGERIAQVLAEAPAAEILLAKRALPLPAVRPPAGPVLSLANAKG